MCINYILVGFFMNKNITKIALCVISIISLISCTTENKTGDKTPVTNTPAVVTKVSFSDAKAVFSAKCVSCHSTSSKNGGIQFDTDATIIANATKANTAAVVIGRMPPKEKLTAEEKNVIKMWVEQGAKPE